MDKKQIGWRPSEFRSVEEVGYEADETEKKNREILQSEITRNFTFVLLNNYFLSYPCLYNSLFYF